MELQPHWTISSSNTIWIQTRTAKTYQKRQLSPPWNFMKKWWRGSVMAFRLKRKQSKCPERGKIASWTSLQVLKKLQKISKVGNESYQAWSGNSLRRWLINAPLIRIKAKRSLKLLLLTLQMHKQSQITNKFKNPKLWRRSECLLELRCTEEEELDAHRQGQGMRTVWASWPESSLLWSKSRLSSVWI